MKTEAPNPRPQINEDTKLQLLAYLDDEEQGDDIVSDAFAHEAYGFMLGLLERIRRDEDLVSALLAVLETLNERVTTYIDVEHRLIPAPLGEGW